jgi:hypothetical protein
MRYTWRVSDPDEARRITEMILPWLGERRSAKAQEVLEHLRTRPGMGGYQRAKTHCPKGHEYTPENTIYKGGENKYRTCRTCAKVWWTAQNAKKEPGAPRIETSSCRVCGKTFSFQVKTRHPTSCSDECRKEARRQDQRNFHQRRKSQSQGQVISA